jgi:hypothetical protein
MEWFVRRVFKGVLSTNRSGFTVIEIAFRVDVQPTSGLVVFIALDVACLPLPFVSFRFLGQSYLDWSVMPFIDIGFGADNFRY